MNNAQFLTLLAVLLCLLWPTPARGVGITFDGLAPKDLFALVFMLKSPQQLDEKTVESAYSFAQYCLNARKNR